jgi:hypothetical protein
MLDHECDGRPPRARHGETRAGDRLPPDAFLTVVGPDAGFVVAPRTRNQSNGRSRSRRLRKNNWAASPQICTFEEACTGAFQALNQFCLCIRPASRSTSRRHVNAAGACGQRCLAERESACSSRSGSDAGRIRPSTGQPVRPLRFRWLSTLDGCTGRGSQEWYEGVETIRGYLAYDFAGNPLGNQFEDLASSNLSPTSPAPRIGAPHVAYWILNFNM